VKSHPCHLLSPNFEASPAVASDRQRESFSLALDQVAARIASSNPFPGSPDVEGEVAEVGGDGARHDMLSSVRFTAATLGRLSPGGLPLPFGW